MTDLEKLGVVLGMLYKQRRWNEIELQRANCAYEDTEYKRGIYGIIEIYENDCNKADEAIRLTKEVMKNIALEK